MMRAAQDEDIQRPACGLFDKSGTGEASNYCIVAQRLIPAVMATRGATLGNHDVGGGEFVLVAKNKEKD